MATPSHRRALARIDRHAAAVALCLVALVGCGSAAERAFDRRDRLPSCGAHRLGHGEAPPPDAVSCLLDGERRRGAELAITRSTVEGDPVVTYYRARPGDPGFEIFTDSTDDRFGSGEWSRRVCERLTLEESDLVASGCD